MTRLLAYLMDRHHVQFQKTHCIAWVPMPFLLSGTPSDCPEARLRVGYAMVLWKTNQGATSAVFVSIHTRDFTACCLLVGGRHNPTEKMLS